MENKNNHSGGIGGGFLLGLLIGMLLTLLVTTKKGREILREFIDKVIQKISAIDEMKDKLETAVEYIENDYVKPKSQQSADTENSTNEVKSSSQPAKKTANEPVNNNKPHRRLFQHKSQKN